MKRILALMPMTLCLAAAPQGRAAPEPTYRDVAYGSEPAQKLDAYLAPGTKGATAFVLIHGGGWRGGDKAERLEAMGSVQRYADSGISLLSINYRLTGVAPWPAQVEDAARAVQSIRSRSREWNIDPSKIVVGGGSAGGHIAMMLAMGKDGADPSSQDAVARQSTRVSCVIQKGGPVDLETMVRALVPEAMTDGATTATQIAPAPQALALAGMSPADFRTDAFFARLRQMSPRFAVTKDCPPIFSLYNGPDGVVSADDPRLHWEIHSPLSAFLLDDAMNANGATHEWLIQSGLMDSAIVLLPDVQDKIIAFIKKNTAGGSPP